MKWLLLGLAGLLVVIALWGLGQWRWSQKTQSLTERLESARLPPPTEAHRGRAGTEKGVRYPAGQ